jgi:hypothetical protein
MDPESQSRIARNESLFRAANEAIERGMWPEQEDQVVRFRCECGNECGQPVELTPREYERVRENGRWFIVLEGHDIPGTEEVVERHPSYTVVRKTGTGGQVAEELDPRE